MLLDIGRHSALHKPIHQAQDCLCIHHQYIQGILADSWMQYGRRLRFKQLLAEFPSHR